MENLKNYADRRQTGFCVFCGAGTETRDHVPSKVFLDEPYPADLPVVPACRACNESFALDEEYLACLIECVVSGSTQPKYAHREKIRHILERKPALVIKLERSRVNSEAATVFFPEMERVHKIVLKLARGHAAYELNEPQLASPTRIAAAPLLAMDERTRESFEEIPDTDFEVGIWPEVGSRAMQRLLIADGSAFSPWVTVQEERYRYLALADGGVTIRGVLRGYLAYEVEWAGG